MGSLIQDVRYAFRVLLKKKGFTLVAVLTLAFGIGANATIFSVVDAIVFRPLPVREPDTLVYVFNTGVFLDQDELSYPDYLDFRDKNEVFSGMAAYVTDVAVLGRGDQTDLASGEFVTGNYFDLLGVKARLGRTIRQEDDQAEGAPVAVISYATWRRRFGGDPNVIGQTIGFSKTPFTIIGVTDQDFTGLQRGLSSEFWIPIGKQEALFGGDRLSLRERRNPSFSVVARLNTGVSVEQARTNMAAVARGLEEAYPDTNRDKGVVLIPVSSVAIHPSADRAVFASSAVVMALSGFVLLIASANLANLLLARAWDRRREIAVRLSVGGSRRRVIRQLLTESVVLALMGGAAGLLVAVWCAGFLNVVELPLPVQLALGVQLDWRVFAFTLGISVLTGIIFGLVPALQASKPDLTGVLRDESGSMKGSRRHALLRSGLVVSQVAVSLVLLVFAGLAARSLRNASSIDPGFNSANVAVAIVDTSLRGYDEIRGRNFLRELLSRVRALPGVRSAGMAGNLPLTFSIRLMQYTMEGEENLPRREWKLVDSAVISPGYFETMEIPIVEGRDFSDRDRERELPLVIVNQTMAKRFWPDRSPIGRRIHIALGLGGLSPAEIVGVVKDGKYRTLGEATRPFVYVHAPRNDFGQLIVRTEGDPRSLFGAIRGTVSALDQNMPVFSLETITDRMGMVLLLPRYAAVLFGAFGLLGAFLAVLGLYGVVSYSVRQRTHEIGVRMAVGGQSSDILKLIVGEGMILTGMGLAIGLVLAAVLARFISVMFYGVGSADPLTFAAISILMIAVTLTACYIPARRASRVDPMVALRYE